MKEWKMPVVTEEIIDVPTPPEEKRSVAKILFQEVWGMRKIKFNRTSTSISHDSEYQSQLASVTDLYKQVKCWHGTGRYKYSGDAGVADIFQSIIQDGGLMPHPDEFDKKSGAMEMISTAHSRMYARLYAGMFMPNATRIENELGSRELWGYYFFATLGMKAVREYWPTIRQIRRGDPAVERQYRKLWVKWKGKITQEEATVKDVFLNGSDIQGNYPILFGIKKDFGENASISKAIQIHERRVISSIPLDDVSHLEVPRAKVGEIKEMLRVAGYSTPVIPIEFGEEYCRNFTFRQLVRGKPLELRG